MPESLTERNGNRRDDPRVYLAGGALVLVVIVVLVGVWVWMPAFKPAATTGSGMRTLQNQGESVAGTTTKPSPYAQYNAGDSATLARDHAISATAQPQLTLAPKQIQAIQNYAAQQQPQTANFTITVGAAVPKQVQLHDMPAQLQHAVPAAQGDQYVLVPHHFVIVEKQTRRIVAIVPA